MGAATAALQRSVDAIRTLLGRARIGGAGALVCHVRGTSEGRRLREGVAGIDHHQAGRHQAVTWVAPVQVFTLEEVSPS